MMSNIHPVSHQQAEIDRMNAVLARKKKADDALFVAVGDFFKATFNRSAHKSRRQTMYQAYLESLDAREDVYGEEDRAR